MISSQATSNDDQQSLVDSTVVDSTDEPLDNRREEFSSNANDEDNAQETLTSVRDGKVPKPDDERKLFVGQLSSDITKEDLEKYFSDFGSIEDVTIKYDVPGGRARGFAFILFDDKESIQKVLNVQSHLINQCQIDPKQAHRRPPVTNPVKKIFIGQLPADFVEQDLSDYFSQFGIVETIELPMDRGKSVRRPFGFVSFSSEKTAEEVLRQQRHSIHGASIEVRPAKPRPHEQQQMQMQQQYQYGEYMMPHHHPGGLLSSLSASSMTPQTIMGVHTNPNSYYTATANTNHYTGQIIDQWSQGANNGGAYWSTANSDIRANNNNNHNPISQWSTGNSMSSSTSLYQPSHQASMYNPNGIAQQGSYAPSTYSAHLSSTGNIYGTGYTSSSAAAAAAMIPSNEIPSSSSPASWNQYAAANNLANGATAAAYDPNMYFAPYYANLFAQQYYPQQQTMSQSQAPGPIDQTISPGGLVTSSNGTGSAPTGAAAVIPANGGGSAVSSGGGVGTEKNYPHLSR